jgi:hypothetical protein
MLLPEQQQIATALGYEPLTEADGQEQYPVECCFQDPLKGQLPYNGAVRKNKKGVLMYYWIPKGRNYKDEQEDLIGWYEVPTMEDIEEWTFDSICLTPTYDEVEPDHPDSWLSLLGMI